MLITHVRANDLLGKKVYGSDGQVLGEVVGIAGRHGVVRAVILRNEENVLRLPMRDRPSHRLRVLH